MKPSITSSITEFCTLGVQDLGVGIPKSQQKRVFDRFFRADNINEERMTGYGLGLYIPSQIIKQQHGKIWVKSVAGKGSTFYLCLPCVDETVALDTSS